MTKREAGYLINNAIAAGRASLLEPDAKKLLSAWGIPVPKSIFIKGEDELTSLQKRLSPPFVVKVVSYEILHKSDIGGVATGIYNEDEVRQAIDDISISISKNAPKAGIEGFLLEENAPKGVEIIIGGLRDEQFGPTVMFGIGGIAVELLKDVSYRLAPIDKGEATAMITEVRSYPILTGFRGSRPIDISALADVLVLVSEMISEITEIKEMEINPLVVYEKGMTAVDVRVLIDKV